MILSEFLSRVNPKAERSVGHPTGQAVARDLHSQRAALPVGAGAHLEERLARPAEGDLQRGGRPLPLLAHPQRVHQRFRSHRLAEQVAQVQRREQA
jgi:hypothetical protein